MGFAASFDEDMSLKSILSRKALVAVTAWERLDGQMDSLVSLEIVVAVEALGALVASEWSIVRRIGMMTSLVTI